MRAAALRALGLTQVEAAKSVGVSRRTLQTWEGRPEWPDAVEEARALLPEEVEAQAVRALLRTLARTAEQGDVEGGRVALQVLERLNPAFRPPPQRHEHSGAEGGEIRHSVLVLPALLDRSDDRRDA